MVDDETPKTNARSSYTNEIPRTRRDLRFYGSRFGGARDMYGVLGYPQVVDSDDFLKMYQRNDIAFRLIRAYPQATWRDDPVVDDDRDQDSDQDSEFVTAWKDLYERFRVSNYLSRADRLSGLGRFSILVMGFADGKDLSEPLEPGNYPLLYLAPFGEANITVSQWDQDVSSPRFGKPQKYTCQQGNSSNEMRSAVRSINVHYSRVIHIAEFTDDDETYGTPRLLPVYNRLLDLEKLSGGSAEAFWLMANRGIVVTADNDSQLTPADRARMKQDAEDYQHQLNRVLALQGASVDSLGSDIPQPKETADFILSLISGTSEIPQRILLGSEQGELASSQDENNWSARVDERRANFAAPMILRPFIQKLIMTQNLPQPAGDWVVYWDKGVSLGESQRADIALKKMQALQSYRNTPLAEDVVGLNEFREMIDLDPKDGADDFSELEELLREAEETPMPEEDDAGI